MYRVLFRVIKVGIHIKEEIQLEIVYKKQNDIIGAKELYLLTNGVAIIDTTTQFLLSKSDPVFEVQVNFTFRNTKKQAGCIQMNLRQWAQNSSYQQVRKLSNNMGKGAIQFDFIYLPTTIPEQAKQLISLQEFEQLENRGIREKMENQNFSLQQQLDYLNTQRNNLIDSNRQTQQLSSQMIQQNSKAEVYQRLELTSHQERMWKSQNSLTDERMKTQFLLNLVRNSGCPELRDAVEMLQMMEEENTENERTDCDEDYQY